MATMKIAFVGGTGQEPFTARKLHDGCSSMFRFSIRDVLWLTVVVGLGVALWIQVQRANRVDAEWIESVSEIAFNWAKDKGSPVTIETPRFQIQMSPNGVGDISDRP